VHGAVDLVGGRPAGQAFPLQQPGQFGMVGVVVERAPGELPDVSQAAGASDTAAASLSSSSMG